MIKSIYEKPTADTMLHGERLMRKGTGMFTLTLVFNVVLAVLTSTIRWRKVDKGHLYCNEEVKLTYLHMI
jgi:hypothetical protein